MPPVLYSVTSHVHPPKELLLQLQLKGTISTPQKTHFMLQMTKIKAVIKLFIQLTINIQFIALFCTFHNSHSITTSTNKCEFTARRMRQKKSKRQKKEKPRAKTHQETRFVTQMNTLSPSAVSALHTFHYLIGTMSPNTGETNDHNAKEINKQANVATLARRAPRP